MITVAEGDAFQVSDTCGRLVRDVQAWDRSRHGIREVDYLGTSMKGKYASLLL